MTPARFIWRLGMNEERSVWTTSGFPSNAKKYAYKEKKKVLVHLESRHVAI